MDANASNLPVQNSQSPPASGHCGPRCANCPARAAAQRANHCLALLLIAVSLLCIVTCWQIISTGKFYREMAERQSELSSMQQELAEVSTMLLCVSRELSSSSPTLQAAAEAPGSLPQAPAPDNGSPAGGMAPPAPAGNAGNQAPPTRTAYFTFDDGPSRNTEKILAILHSHNVPAVFFVTGNDSAWGREIYRKIAAAGHRLGNHTYSHDYARIYRSAEAFFADMRKLEELLVDLTGVRPVLLRFPGGSNNHVSRRYGGAGLMRELAHLMTDKGYIYCDWNIDAGDASLPRRPPQAISDKVLKEAEHKEKAIILLHDGAHNTATVEALPAIITGLKKMGFHFELLSGDSYNIQF